MKDQRKTRMERANNGKRMNDQMLQTMYDQFSTLIKDTEPDAIFLTVVRGSQHAVQNYGNVKKLLGAVAMTALNIVCDASENAQVRKEKLKTIGEMIIKLSNFDLEGVDPRCIKIDL